LAKQPFQGALLLRPDPPLDSVANSNASLSDTCCRPNIGLQIATASALWGFPAYWGYRAFFDDPNAFAPEIGIIGAAIFLPVLTVAPVARWTSSCDANWWNALWIGFASDVVCSIAYGVIYGNTHVLNYFKFNWPEYFALGVAPAVLTTVVYNMFLSPKVEVHSDEPDDDQGMIVLPSVGPDKSFGLSLGVRF
jgi:hypothetical protein